MKLLGLVAVYPKPRSTIPNISHKKYPYLLRDMLINRPDQVWCMDITYLRMRHGFVYLTAVMDWYSRYVIGWQLSNTLDSSFCIEVVSDAFLTQKPEIFNTDQGVQFTSTDFIKMLKKADVLISMDGKGRWMDNVFIERLWRTVKYELVYLREYDTLRDLHRSLLAFFEYYNNRRPHQTLEMQTPYAVYHGQEHKTQNEVGGSAPHTPRQKVNDSLIPLYSGNQELMVDGKTDSVEQWS